MRVRTHPSPFSPLYQGPCEGGARRRFAAGVSLFPPLSPSPTFGVWPPLSRAAINHCRLGQVTRAYLARLALESGLGASPHVGQSDVARGPMAVGSAEMPSSGEPTSSLVGSQACQA